MRRVHVRKAVLFRGWTWRIKNDTKAGITGSYRDPHSAARELLVLSGETGPSSTPNMDDNFHDIPESPRFCKMFWKTIAGASLLIGAGVMLGRASLSFPRQQPQIRPQAIVQAHTVPRDVLSMSMTTTAPKLPARKSWQERNQSVGTE